SSDLIVGLLGGVVLAAIARVVARSGAQRAAKAARAALRAEVALVAQRAVVDPVAAELATLAEFRTTLAVARGDA
ncbi:MAG: GTP-binding protein, partial [Actinomycetota bacterium]|nr:GTP-binding protein [Actinomycetota bacterium]